MLVLNRDGVPGAVILTDVAVNNDIGNHGLVADDRDRGAADPVVVIGTANLDPDIVVAGFGEGGILGQIERIAVERVEDLVGIGLRVGNGDRVSLTVIGALPAFDGDVFNFGGADDHVAGTGPVVVVFAADLDVDEVDAGIGVGRIFGGVGLAVFGVKNNIAVLGVDRDRIGVAVVIDIDTVDGDIVNRGRSDNNIGIAVPVVIVGTADLDVGRVGADIRERRKRSQIIGFAVERVGNHIALLQTHNRYRVETAVIDCFNAGNRHVGDIGRVNIDAGAAIPVVVVGAAHFDKDVVSADLGKGRILGKIIGFTVERVSDHIAVLNTFDFDRIGVAVIGFKGIDKFDTGNLGGSNHNIGVAVEIIITFAADLDVGRVGADIRIGRSLGQFIGYTVF